MGSGFDEVGLRDGFIDDLFEDVEKVVEGGFGLTFGGFDEETFFDDEGKVDGRGVDGVVEKPFSNILSFDVGGKAIGLDDEFVAARLRKRDSEEPFDPFFEIIGIEGCDFSNAPKAEFSMKLEVEIGAQKSGKVAVEGGDMADRLRRGSHLDPLISLFLHSRKRQKGFKFIGTKNRAGTRTSPSVRGGERFVKIEVADVKAHVAGSYSAENGIEVGAIVEKKASRLMDEAGDI